VVRNGSSSRTQLLIARPRQLRSGCGGTFWPSSAPRIGPRGVQISNPWTINCGWFGGHGMPKASQQPGEPEEIPCEGSSRHPPGYGACDNSRLAGASHGLH